MNQMQRRILAIGSAGMLALMPMRASAFGTHAKAPIAETINAASRNSGNLLARNTDSKKASRKRNAPAGEQKKPQNEKSPWQAAKEAFGRLFNIAKWATLASVRLFGNVMHELTGLHKGACVLLSGALHIGAFFITLYKIHNLRREYYDELVKKGVLWIRSVRTGSAINGGHFGYHSEYIRKSDGKVVFTDSG